SISLNEHSSLRDLLGQVKGTPVQVEILRHGKRDIVEGTVIGTPPPHARTHARTHTRLLTQRTRRARNRSGEEVAGASESARGLLPGAAGRGQGRAVLQPRRRGQAALRERAHAAGPAPPPHHPPPGGASPTNCRSYPGGL